MRKIPLLPSYFRLIGIVLVLMAIALYGYDAFHQNTAHLSLPFLFGHLLLLIYIIIFNYHLFKINRAHEE